MSSINTLNVKGLADFGYQQAQYDDAGSAFVVWARANVPGFPDAVSDEDKRLILQGYQHRKQDITTPLYYLREGKDMYSPANGPGKDVVRVDPDYVMSWSQQQFGTLKGTQPNLYAIVTPVRNSVTKYMSNKWKALLRMDRAMNAEPRKRDGNSSYSAYLDDVCEQLQARAKTALARGDETAPGVERAKGMAAALKKAYAK